MLTDACALIDSHCHPHFPPLGEDIAGVVAAMREHGVVHALAVATCLAEVNTVKRLVTKYGDFFSTACGVHPTTDKNERVSVDDLVRLCVDESVLAIGETGLDFFRDEVPEAVQRERFAVHIAAARELHKPLIIHTRDSLDSVLDMLRAEKADEVGGVLHCYTGDVDGARRGLDVNFMVSFSGIASFKKAEQLREVARYIPASRYLIETDAPYLAPTPYRGKTNTPGYVRFVAAAVAAARGYSEAQVAAETTANFRQLFNVRSFGGLPFCAKI